MAVLLVAMLKMPQKKASVTFVGASLSNVIRLVGDAKSYSKRLFDCGTSALSNKKHTDEPSKKLKTAFFGAILQCAQSELEPSGALGHYYLLPYGKTCQLIIDYRGYDQSRSPS